MDFHAEETLVSPDGTYIFSPLGNKKSPQQNYEDSQMFV